MNALKPDEIVDQVTKILRDARKCRGSENCCLTAYQMLERLPDSLRKRVMAERGRGGRGTGASFSAASLVAKAADILVKQGQAAKAYLDTRGITIKLAGKAVKPGNEVTGLYCFRVPTGK